MKNESLKDNFMSTNIDKAVMNLPAQTGYVYNTS